MGKGTTRTNWTTRRKGDTGDIGPQGLKGDKGDTGDIGAQR